MDIIGFSFVLRVYAAQVGLSASEAYSGYQLRQSSSQSFATRLSSPMLLVTSVALRQRA
jgi:hypothetical protein